MESTFQIYLRSVGVSEKGIEIVETIIEELSVLFEGVKFDDIFVCNVKSEDTTLIDSLWLGGSGYVVECKNFMSNRDDYDLVRAIGAVKYYNIQKSNYSIVKGATEESSVFISISLNDSITSIIKGYGKNCDSAVNFAQKYFLSDLLAKG